VIITHSYAPSGGRLRLLNQLNLILLIHISTKITRAGMCFKVLCSGSPSTESAKIATGLFRGDLLVGAGFQVLANPQTTGVTGGGASGQNVIGADNLR
jgi:hypothetical protein